MIFLHQEFGTSDIEAGTVYGAWGLCITLWGLSTAFINDILGVRRSLMIGFSVSTVASLIIATTTSKEVLYATLFVILPLGNSMGLPMLTVGIKRYTTSTNRGFAFGLFYAVMNVAAFASGIVVDFFNLYYQKKVDRDGGLSGNRMVILSTTCTYIISLFITYRYLREIRVVEDSNGDTTQVEGHDNGADRDRDSDSDRDRERDSGSDKDRGRGRSRTHSDTDGDSLIGDEERKSNGTRSHGVIAFDLEDRGNGKGGQNGRHRGMPSCFSIVDSDEDDKEEEENREVNIIFSSSPDLIEESRMKQDGGVKIRREEFKEKERESCADSMESAWKVGEVAGLEMGHIDGSCSFRSVETVDDDSVEHFRGTTDRPLNKPHTTGNANDNSSSGSQRSRTRDEGVQAFSPDQTGFTTTVKGIFHSATFWRFVGLTLFLINLRAIFRHLDATLPTYLLRVFGSNYPKGMIYSINPFMIIWLTPVVAALTSTWPHFDMIKWGGYISAASPLFMAFSTSTWAVVMFVITLSLGEAIWSPRLYDYTMSIAPQGREASFSALAAAPLFAAKIPVGLLSGYLLQTYLPDNSADGSGDGSGGHAGQHPQTMWLVIGLVTLTSPICITLFERWIREPMPAVTAADSEESPRSPTRLEAPLSTTMSPMSSSTDNTLLTTPPKRGGPSSSSVGGTVKNPMYFSPPWSINTTSSAPPT